jgi:hypothetical protein
MRLPENAAVAFFCRQSRRDFRAIREGLEHLVILDMLATVNDGAYAHVALPRTLLTPARAFVEFFHFVRCV